jgi:hypothetical protein
MSLSAFCVSFASVDREELVLGLERAVGERSAAGPLEILLVEAFLVDDEDAAGLRIVDVGLERRGVHRDEDVELVAGGEDLARREVQLEGADAGERARGSPDLGREVRQRRDVVAGDRGLGRELRSRDLHAVAGVAGESDDDRVE